MLPFWGLWPGLDLHWYPVAWTLTGREVGWVWESGGAPAMGRDWDGRRRGDVDKSLSGPDRLPGEFFQDDGD